MTGDQAGRPPAAGRSPAGDAASPGIPSPELAAEWLGRLDELGRPAGHELRNALNGIAVNLEVIRSRSARIGHAAEGLTPFAEAAVEQVELLSGLLDVVLSLMRAQPEPVDLAQLLQRLGLLLDAIARGRGGSVAVTTPDAVVPMVTGAAGGGARLMVLTLLLEAFDPTAELSCELAAATQPTLRVRRSGSPLPPPPEGLVSLAALAGASAASDAGGWVVVFPPSATQG